MSLCGCSGLGVTGGCGPGRGRLGPHEYSCAYSRVHSGCYGCRWCDQWPARGGTGRRNHTGTPTPDHLCHTRPGRSGSARCVGTGDLEFDNDIIGGSDPDPDIVGDFESCPDADTGGGYKPEARGGAGRGGGGAAQRRPGI